MATISDATWLRRTLTARCPSITVTVARDLRGELVVTGASEVGTFTENSADYDADTREEFYANIRGYFDDLETDTTHHLTRLADHTESRRDATLVGVR